MAQNPDGLVAEMQGSKNPLLLRNYRFIAPSCWKYINLVAGQNGAAVGPGPTFTDDITLQFKIEAAPVVLTYESELVFRIKCPLRATIAPPAGAYPEPAAGQNMPNAVATQINEEMVRMLKHSLLRGYDTRLPIFRTKLKSMSQIIKRAWATLSNMTFQSVNTPQYLNEILLRRSYEEQRKYPDNYTMEYSNYLEHRPLGGAVQALRAPIAAGAANVQAGEHQWDPAGAMNQFGIANAALNPPAGANPANRFHLGLGRRGAQWTPWDNIAFSTPAWSEQDQSIIVDFRIPLTELLPVFKIGVVPCMMINSSTFDLMIDIYHPKKWFVSTFFDCPRSCEVWLNITTVSFPDINPLAEMLLKPHIATDRFIAPYLDYFTVQNTYDIRDGTSQDFLFNIIQFFRNVPFISLSFVDISTPAYIDPSLSAANRGALNLVDDVLRRPNIGVGNNVVAPPWPVAGNNAFNGNIFNDVGPFEDFEWGLNYEDRVRGGFYNLPPGVTVENLDIRLGESAYPLTQVPIDFNSMYMYNRKHFEMYGRPFNVTRVSPIARHMQGDASYFFDLSHGPMSGFTIDSDSPLQIRGTLIRNHLRHPNPPNDENRSTRIVVLLTIWYSNNFNAMLNSGGVVPLQ